jgi:HSP20 family protein
MRRRVASGAELERLRRHIDDLFTLLTASQNTAQDAWSPAVDLVELEDRFVVRVDLPDVAGPDLELTLRGRELAIAGVKGRRGKAMTRRYVQMERSQGRFAVEVLLPALVDPGACRATLASGVLVITLPLLFGRADAVHTIPLTDEAP